MCSTKLAPLYFSCLCLFFSFCRWEVSSLLLLTFVIWSNCWFSSLWIVSADCFRVSLWLSMSFLQAQQAVRRTVTGVYESLHRRRQSRVLALAMQRFRQSILQTRHEVRIVPQISCIFDRWIRAEHSTICATCIPTICFRLCDASSTLSVSSIHFGCVVPQASCLSRVIFFACVTL